MFGGSNSGGGSGGGSGGAPYGTGGLFGNNLDVFGNTQIVPTSGATATTANTTQNGGLGGRTRSDSALLRVRGRLCLWLIIRSRSCVT